MSFDHFYIGELPGKQGYVDHLYYGGMTSFDVNNDNREDLITGGVQGVIRFCINNFSQLPPLKPFIIGNSSCDKGIDYEYEYRIYTKDINYDNVYYNIDWDDGTTVEWIGPYKSGEEVILKHRWKNYGGHKIRILSKDTNEQKSQIIEFQTILLRERSFRMNTNWVISSVIRNDPFDMFFYY